MRGDKLSIDPSTIFLSAVGLALGVFTTSIAYAAAKRLPAEFGEQAFRLALKIASQSLDIASPSLKISTDLASEIAKSVSDRTISGEEKRDLQRRVSELVKQVEKEQEERAVLAKEVFRLSLTKLRIESSRVSRRREFG